jgi:actin-related protein
MPAPQRRPVHRRTQALARAEAEARQRTERELRQVEHEAAAADAELRRTRAAIEAATAAAVSSSASVEPEPELEPAVGAPSDAGVVQWLPPLHAASLRLQVAKLAHERLSRAAVDGGVELGLDVLALVGARIVPVTTVVFTHGSSRCTVGFGHRCSPCSSFATVVGVPRHRYRHREPVIPAPPSATEEGYFVGDAALAQSGICRLAHPIEWGILCSWDHMETIWRHAFYSELRVPPADCCALLTEAAISPRASRERMTQIFFEVFEARALFLTTKEALTLLATGRSTGIVLSIGVGVLAVPIYEGHTLPYAIRNPRELPNGHFVTDYMMKLLAERGHDFTSSAHREVAREIKERFCYVAADFQAELGKDVTSVQTGYELSDGQVITIGRERFQCPEILFQPSLMGCEGSGIHRYTWASITMCDVSVRGAMLQNVVLAGGCSLFPGMAERFRSDIQALAQETAHSGGSRYPEAQVLDLVDPVSITRARQAPVDLWQD